MIEKENIKIKHLTFHCGLPKTGTTALQKLVSEISKHHNLGAHFFEIKQKKKFSWIERNGDCFIKLFYDKDQNFLRHLKSERNIKKKIIDSLNQFKNSRYENAFVSSEFLCTIPIKSWLQLESFLKNQQISIKNIIITIRNPKERFISSLSKHINDQKYKGNILDDAYFCFVQNELKLYQNIKNLKNLYKDKVIIIDFNSQDERLIDKIFEKANLKKGFPFYNRIDQKINANDFNSNQLSLIFSIINNRSILIIYKFIRKLGLIKILNEFELNQNLLKKIIKELPDHQIENNTLKLKNTKREQIQKLFEEYFKYSTKINYKKKIDEFPMAKLKFRFLFKYILLFHLFQKKNNL